MPPLIEHCPTCEEPLEYRGPPTCGCSSSLSEYIAFTGDYIQRLERKAYEALPGAPTVYRVRIIGGKMFSEDSLAKIKELEGEVRALKRKNRRLRAKAYRAQRAEPPSPQSRYL